MKKLILFSFLSLIYLPKIAADEYTSHSMMLQECVKQNSSCGGLLPVDVGIFNINPSLHSTRIKLNSLCGLKINYFYAEFNGHSKTKMPDGRVFDFGKFHHTIMQDYRYTIYSIQQGKDKSECIYTGGWYADERPRQEHIDLAYRLVSGE